MKDRACLILSLDGIGADCLEHPETKAPTLKRLIDGGASARRLTTIFPSVTWAIHSTVISGRLPEAHGIWGNFAWDRASERHFNYFDADIEADRALAPIPDLPGACSDAGASVAAICWPLTQGKSSIRWNIPEFYDQEAFATRSSPDLYAELASRGFAVGSYAEWSVDHDKGKLQDRLTCDIIKHVVAEKDARLVLGHYLLVDSIQHDHGFPSSETLDAISYVDGLLAETIEAMTARYGPEGFDLIIFSDHGQLSVDTVVNLGAWQGKRGIEGVFAPNGGAAFYYEPAGRPGSAAKVAEALEAEAFVESVHRSDDFKELGLPVPEGPGALARPDLIAAFKPHCFGVVGTRLERLGIDPDAVTCPSPLKGMHGHSPSHAGLDGFLIASGPSFKKGFAIERASMTDIAPLVARAMGLAWEGEPSREAAKLLEEAAP